MGLSTLSCAEDFVKRELKSNCTLEDLNGLDELLSPDKVNDIDEMFLEGIFYGRLRLNSFGFNWKDEIEDKTKDHHTTAIGGSLLYKSAYLNGFGVGLGAYFSENIWHGDDEDSKYYKGGKGSLNRYDVLTNGNYGMTSLAEAYVEYMNSDLSLKTGRFIFESFLTKSNDTKMIPNTFEGVSFETRMIPDTKIKFAYLTKQKLRDHSSFHHIFAYGDDESNPYSKYTQNDDGAMHRGITLSKLKTEGIKDRVVVTELRHMPIDGLVMGVSYTAVPKLFSTAMFEAKYSFFSKNLRIRPALRYLKQFDNGAGRIGGANLRENNSAYSDFDSVNSSLLGLKLDIKDDAWKLKFAYTQVEDKADLIAPWRGFPTGGYTRAMGQYNWYANTKSYMVRFDLDLDKAELLPDVKSFVRFVVQDFDDKKSGVQADSRVLSLDVLKYFESMPNLYLKTRFAYINGDDDIVASDGKLKSDPSYSEVRFELNYLF
jgi:hypothetical protein